ncbi:MAG: aryl-sulfate sulfotransferase [Candidatus Helarchaeota archaeon]
MKLYKNMAILFVCGFIIVFIISNFVVPSFVKVVPNSDVDYINNGKYKGDLLISEYNRVAIWNITKRQIDWEYSGDKRGIIFIHDSDILPNGNILISDTVNDRVIEVNITNKKIVWELDFHNMTQFNWSDYADQWGWGKNSNAREYVLNQKPAHGCWTHINEIQFINNSNLPGVYCPIISVSLRNFDMIIEVSYNAKRK